MPEIAEIARAVHHLKKNIVGKTLSKVTAVDDANVFGKVGTTGAAVQKALQGKKVLDAGRQGKYFWLIMSSPPHPVFHFGMTGWFHIRGDKASHYRQNGVDKEESEWPPKYAKLTLETAGPSKAEAAYTDSRRFGRIRLVDCAAEEIRNTTPLKENGPDPVLDKDILTAEWLEAKMMKKHVPIKALLLDQANISGLGNWVGDEVLYQAKLHPEQYSNTFSREQIQRLHKSIYYVCSFAIDVLADSSKFPEDWMFKHRWGKGKKDSPNELLNGAKITHITVGGRTSAIVPSVQKKTGAVAGDLNQKVKACDSDEGGSEGDADPKRATSKRKSKVKKDAEADEVSEEDVKPKRAATTRKPKVEQQVEIDEPSEEEDTMEEDTSEEKFSSKAKKTAARTSKKRKAADVEEVEVKQEHTQAKPDNVKGKAKKVKANSQSKNDNLTTGRRRSGRMTKAED